MCDPISAIAAVLSAAGGAISSSAQNKAANAVANAQNRASMKYVNDQQRVRAAEKARQDDLQRKRVAASDASIAANERGDFERAQTDNAAKIKEKYQTGIEDAKPDVDIFTSTSDAPGIIQQQIIGSVQKERDFAKDQAAARAMLDAWDVAVRDQAIGRGRVGDQIDMLNSFSRGSRGAQEYEMDATDALYGYRMQKAQSKGDKYRKQAMIGDILSLVGQVGGFAGGFGGFGGSPKPGAGGGRGGFGGFSGQSTGTGIDFM